MTWAVASLAAATPALADPPQANDDNVVAVVGTPLTFNVLDNDTDPDLDTLTMSVSSSPTLGTVTCTPAGDCTYTPTGGPGSDEFTYTASDGTSTATATVFVEVDASPAPAITSAGPLTRIETSPVLNCAVNHAGDGSGEFYGDNACGTFLVVDGTRYSPDSIPAGSGAVGTPWTPVSQSPVTGSGTAASPYQVVTTVAAGSSGVSLIQTDSYVVGQESYRTAIQIKNGSTARTVRLYRAADCYLNDSDSGKGAVDAATGAVACTAPASGRIEQWFPLTAGSHYLETDFSDVWAAISANAVFPNTCDCDVDQDNGAGLQWDVALAANATSTVSSLITFSPTGAQPLVTTKSVDASTVGVGDQVHYTIKLTNPGAVAAHVTQISDTLPAGFAYVTGTTTGATTADPTQAAGTLTWPVSATVAGGGAVTLTFAATAGATAGTYYNNATGQASDDFVVPSGDTAPVTVSTVPVNHAPVAVDDTLTTLQDTAGTVNVVANDTDSDGDTLSVTGHGTPAHGTVSCTATGCTYTPAAGYSGTDSFTYTVSDGHGGTATGTVNVTVTHVNHNPAAVNDTLTTLQDTAGTVNVVANDTDSDGDTLSVTGHGTPAHGTVSCTATGCTYTPAAGYSGTDSFTYTVSDGHGGTATGTVNVTVTHVNHNPAAVNDTLTTLQDTAGTVNVVANDTDSDGDTLSVTGHGTPGHGTVSCTATGCTYTPAAGYSGTDSFTYTVSDGHGGTATGTVNVTVSSTATPTTDVSIVKVALGATVRVGNTTGWQLKVRNSSGVAAQHVVVTDVLPREFRYWKTTGSGCAATHSAALGTTSLRCELGTLLPNQTRVLVVQGAFVAPGVISNTARVSADRDPALANNVSTASARAKGQRCTIVGTFGNDHLHGTRRHDVVCGLGGNDRIDTRGGGRDVVYGNDGHDKCLGDRRDDVRG
ncbi:hypothetical protein GCM10009798_37900 [Nocardioides panacihumi]|uniref:DUF11 domain-containing protein n=1 Tax=Nocardioides panacihumi TaxID=400774 RepID=A0ABN2RQE1_9ACTN